ncbi:MAG: oligosaccharide flippase family protein [Clostridiales bacterium]|nr:oligosaccharide flippase family protein [Clostridiales bacterium]
MSFDAAVLARGGTARVLSMFIQIAIAFLLTPLIARNLGLHYYGLWSIVGDTLSYYALLDLGLSSAVTRYVAHSRGRGDLNEASIFASSSLLVFIIISITVCIVALLTTLFMLYFGFLDNDGNVFALTLLIMALGLAFAFPVRTHIGTLNAWLRFDLTALSGIIRALILALLTYVVIFNNMGLIGLALATLAAQLFECILVLVFYRKNIKNMSISIKFARKKNAFSLFSYSWKSLAIQVAELLRYRTSSFILLAYLDPTAVAIYSIGFRLIEYANQMVVSAIGVFVPVFSVIDGQSDKESLIFYLQKVLRYSVIISIYVMGSVYILGKPFIVAWMGDEYITSFTVTAILVLPMTFALIQNPSISALYGTNKHQHYLLINIFEGIMNLALSVYLTSKYGLIGMPFGVAFPMFISKVIVQPIFVCRALETRVFTVFNRHYWINILKSSIPFLIFILFFKNSLHSTYISIFQHGIILTAFYCVYAWFFLFTKDDRKTIKNLLIFTKSS